MPVFLTVYSTKLKSDFVFSQKKSGDEQRCILLPASTANAENETNFENNKVFFDKNCGKLYPRAISKVFEKPNFLEWQFVTNTIFLAVWDNFFRQKFLVLIFFSKNPKFFKISKAPTLKYIEPYGRRRLGALPTCWI